MGGRAVLAVLALVLAAAAGSADAGKGVAKGKYRALFNFGDSLADAGNLIANGVPEILATARLPYGQTYFGKPTGRCSDGRLVIDHLGECRVRFGFVAFLGFLRDSVLMGFPALGCLQRKNSGCRCCRRPSSIART